MSSIAAIFAAFICVSVSRAAAIKCLSCTAAARPRDCEYVQECGVHEKCSIESVLTTTSYIRYNVGCMDSSKCTSLGRKRTVLNATVPQKIEQKDKFGAVPEEQWDPSSNEILVCAECCDTELCNVKGCGEEGFPTDSGPICYGCEQERYPDTCNKIILCGRDETCHLSSKLVGVDVVYKSDCIQRQLCHQEGVLDTGASILTGRGLKDADMTSRLKRSVVCNTCCTGNLCNLDICSSLAHPAITFPPWTHPTTTLPPTTIAAPGNCIDRISNCINYDKTYCSNHVYSQWMAENCGLYCEICGSCTDRIGNCRAYPPSVCYDPSYSKWVEEYCCAYCRGGCTDKIGNCQAYGTSACSGTYERWARDNCPLFCNLCGSSGGTIGTGTGGTGTGGTGTGGTGTMTGGTGTMTGGTGTMTGGCMDKSSNCAQLDQMQHICSDSGARIYAQNNCPRTCNLCSSSCADKITNCAAYGSSVCTDATYSGWVTDNCAKSCNKCSATGGTMTGGTGGTLMGGTGGTITGGTGGSAMTFGTGGTMTGGTGIPMIGGTGTGTGGGMTGHSSGCVYKTQVHQQGESWNDGCDFKCTCTDGTSGQYTCTAMCVTWQLPPSCTLNPPAPGKCCTTPSCPAGFNIQYPPGYQSN